MTTMRDVAALAGVSAKTVSRVYNDEPHVAVETPAHVAAALARLNYQPNTLATTFRSGRWPVIGVAVPDVGDHFFGAIASVVETVAAEHNMLVVISSLGTDATRERHTVTSMMRQALSV